jgi:uncharacterized membrane protein
MVATPGSRGRRILDSPLAPVALLVFFAVLVVLTIHRFSIWIDESSTLVLVRSHSAAEIVGFIRYDAHPPLWYLVLKPWISVFGDSIVASRAQSALFMLIAFPVWYHFLKTRFSRPLALLALALLVTNPMLLHYAIEGRMYAWGILLTSVSCLLITGHWRWRWIAYWVCAAAMLWTHYFLALVVLAQFGYLLLARKDQGRSIVWIVIYGASIIAAFAPWLPHALQMTRTAVTNGLWIGPVTPDTVASYVLSTFLHHLNGELAGRWVFPGLAFMAAWAASLIRAGRARGGPYALLWLLIAIPWACLFILSCKPFIPIFHPRYVIFGLPALITLLAVGALLLTGRWRIAVIAILLVGQLSGIRMLRWKGFNDNRGYWAMNAVAKDVRKPIDGELPVVVSAWLFPFMDALATLDPHQQVINFRDSDPVDETIPDVMYLAHPEWYVRSLDEIHARHVWFLDEKLKVETTVPSSWTLVTTHYRGYARERLFTLPP